LIVKIEALDLCGEVKVGCPAFPGVCVAWDISGGIEI